ncbi:MAG: M23 family metallopeptidase [Prolixibacteraceae bacterium]
MRGITFIFIFCLLGSKLLAQQPDFAPPLDIPLLLNANFGEIRPNHFHTGIDIKTKGETGLAIYSIDDGYVSRISVSASGYGNALYINHPSGYTSVYGHLDRFSPKLAAWVKAQQYEKNSFEVNLFPSSYQFKVKKGEEVAKSGNSGSSAGPHLHFEIRNTESEHPLNPLFFNYDIKDATKPSVENLFVYPISNTSQVQNKTTKQVFKLVNYANAYHLKGMQSINVYGEIGFGVDAIDYLDGNWSKCGIYQMEYWVDNQLINTFELDELDFSTNRYINSHIDYEAMVLNGQKVHKTFIDPGNKLKIYHQSNNRGLFNFNDGKRHKIQIILFDAKMNASEINFYVIATEAMQHSEKKPSAIFHYASSNHFETENVDIDLPEGALYTDLNFEFKEGLQPKAAFSPLYKIHSKGTPLQKNIELKIKANNLPKKLEDKAVLAIFNTQNGKFTSIGGEFEKGWVSASTRTFGNTCIAVDTIAPVIIPLSIKNNTLSEAQKIRFKITDEFSGIKSYSASIDKHWILFEFDAKRDLLEYNIDDHLKKGKKHELVLKVEDVKGNVKTYTSSFYY